jgi:hypothetical protein
VVEVADVADVSLYGQEEAWEEEQPIVVLRHVADVDIVEVLA